MRTHYTDFLLVLKKAWTYFELLSAKRQPANKEHLNKSGIKITEIVATENCPVRGQPNETTHFQTKQNAFSVVKGHKDGGR